MSGISISGRKYDSLTERARQSAGISAVGMQIDPTTGNPILVADPDLKRWVTARITGIATQADGVTPLVDNNCNQMYTWVEEQRYINSQGYPDWQDATDVAIDCPRGSQKISAGVYLNLAHEANGLFAKVDDHVIMWAGVLNLNGTNGPDYDHIFYKRPTPIIRVQIAANWYSCGSVDAIVLDYHNSIPIDGFPSPLSPGSEHVLCYDPMGSIDGMLLAQPSSSGELFLPADSWVTVWQPQDACDGHYEPLVSGNRCTSAEVESGSESSGGSEGSAGSEGSGCPEGGTLPPYPVDASSTNVYVLVCDGGCPRWMLTENCQTGMGS